MCLSYNFFLFFLGPIIFLEVKAGCILTDLQQVQCERHSKCGTFTMTFHKILPIFLTRVSTCIQSINAAVFYIVCQQTETAFTSDNIRMFYMRFFWNPKHTL